MVRWRWTFRFNINSLSMLVRAIIVQWNKSFQDCSTTSMLAFIFRFKLIMQGITRVMISMHLTWTTSRCLAGPWWMLPWKGWHLYVELVLHQRLRPGGKLTFTVAKSNGQGLSLWFTLADICCDIPDPTSVAAYIGWQLHVRCDWYLVSLPMFVPIFWLSDIP